MFRHLRSKIILSFCLLMIAGGIVTTTVVERNLSRTLSSSVERDGLVFARTLATQLSEPVAYRDHVAVRRLLVQVRTTHPDLIYAFVASADGAVTDHSFPTDRFPADLLGVARMDRPSTLRTEVEAVRDLPCRIAEGVLGTVHVGVSTARVAAGTLEAVRNVLVTTGLAMVVGIFGILVLAGLITRPLRGLMVAARRLGTGDPTAQAVVVGRDELADLALAFNQMAAAVRERAAEGEALRAYVERILDHMDSAIVVASEDLRVEYANLAARKGFGALIGARCCEVLREERPCDACPAAAVLKSGRTAMRTHRAATGRTYELTFVPMTGHDGRRSVVEKALDVTERRELAERFQRAERLAVAGEIAAGVVHAVNNPLDGVRRALDLAAKDLDDRPRVTRMLGLASEGTERIAEITHTLLGFARAESPPAPVSVEPSAIIEGAVELVRLKAHSRTISLRTECANTVPEIRVDPQAIKEVLVNLLLNAIDACRPGGEIVVEARAVDPNLVEIVTRDNGAGIAPEDLARVFEPFFTTKEIGCGTGLGLSIARRIVEANGGEIDVESAPGSGTAFRVRLPRPGPDAAPESDAS